ncbi:MAG TPA: type VI secretion system Vgr family protein [Alcaligenes sp.]|nr:type VI secretion system Vgr family protein [Alcaligenes sp.]
MPVSFLETIDRFAQGALQWERRPVTLFFGPAQDVLGRFLAVQHARIHEGLMTGIQGELTCLSARRDLSPRLFLGVPVSVRLLTDQGREHAISAIVQDVSIGQSDGELCVYRLRICDALSLMDKRINSRVFRQLGVVDILTILLTEWRQRSATLAAAFEFDISGLRAERYPVRELTRQVNESDAAFVRRLLRREGITVFMRHGSAQAQNRQGDDTPVHTLVCCDDPMSLPLGPAGTVRLHSRNAAVEERDAITHFALHQSLAPGAVSRPSWDYKKARMDESVVPAAQEQGTHGNDLARLLTDTAIDIPHTGDSWDDHDRLTLARALAHQGQAQRHDGISAVRDLAVGAWILLDDGAMWSQLPSEQRQFVITSIDHSIWNNLPKELNERALALLPGQTGLTADGVGGVPVACPQEPTRYQNRFSCVRRGAPLTPPYDPRKDLPAVHLLTGTIVGPEDDEVFCDDQGRVRARIHGLDPSDHAHAQGAGVSGTARDSAPLRVSSCLAGNGFGGLFLPRIGMEVLLGCLAGDPDRLVILGVLSNGAHPPTTFSHTGNLPGNRYLSGIKTQEIKGSAYNQLRFDDTPGEISTQLASEQAHSQLNLGFLTQPRQQGKGQERGVGAELRTDAAMALRAAQGMLLTTYARSQAQGGQLDRDELLGLLEQCQNLFHALGSYAGEHGGQAADTQGQQNVSDAMRNWSAPPPAASSSDARADAQALLTLGAQAGTISLTPKTHLTFAGENIDQVAQQHLQLMSGQRFNVTAGQGIQLFARGTGVQAVAGEGPVLLQAQDDELTANAQKGLTLTSTENEVLITAPVIRLVAADGSYIKIGDGVTLGTQDDIQLLAASHQWGGPSKDQVDVSAFSRKPTDQQFQLHYPEHSADRPALAANQAYRISLNDGRVVEGVSDDQGRTSLVQDEVMRIARIGIMK